MTLAKTKPRKPTAAHKKRRAQHHRQSSHYLRPYWPYLPIIAVVFVGLVFNSWYAHAGKNVLGYATDMSAGSLLAGTNDQRLASGLGALALNGSLNQAAQNKANDMATRDYWSHNTPDGQAPWTFITAVGYSYQTAGENLAYGFTTASDTITGWMNSPGHRANILNSSFQEVGFGMANAPNYQGSGPQTIVVAMYAQPYGAPAPAPAPTPAPAPAPAQTSPKPIPAAAPAATPQAAPDTSQQNPETQSASGASGGGDSKPAEDLPANATSIEDAPEDTKGADTVPSQDVSRMRTLSVSRVALSQFSISIIVFATLLAFLLRHSLAWHRVLRRGERFILHHPLLDILLIAVATLGFVLLQTSGTIR